MSQLPITPEQIAALPPEFRALLQAVIDHFEKRIAGLEAELTAVKAELAATQKEPSGRKRGGQPGHPRHERALIPTEQCQSVIPVKPKTCRRCGHSLSGSDTQALRHQVWDIPEIKPLIT